MLHDYLGRGSYTGELESSIHLEESHNGTGEEMILPDELEIILADEFNDT
jgi:hypothetical protein